MSPAILLCDDLFFGSKVEAAGRVANRQVVVAPSLGQLKSALSEHAASDTPLTLIVDLECSGAKLDEIAEDVSGLAQAPKLIAYAGHRLTERLQTARDAGYHEVLTRGQFDEQLVALLTADA